MIAAKDLEDPHVMSVLLAHPDSLIKIVSEHEKAAADSDAWNTFLFKELRDWKKRLCDTLGFNPDETSFEEVLLEIYRLRVKA